MSLAEASRLSFFKVGKYEYKNENVCDFREIPRPHFCMGLIIKGQAVFTENDCKSVRVEPGDIIFVPITSRYISEWKGDPDIYYISMHFAFEPENRLFEQQRPAVQRVHIDDFQRLKLIFEHIYEKQSCEQISESFEALGEFFELLGEIMPLLKKEKLPEHDKRLDEAVNYLRLNSEKEISVFELAEMCNMSVSNFYLQFKKYTKMTPIEYLNNMRVECAMRLLKAEKTLSIERISDMIGFESATYFRRVFKKVAGITPREYRKKKIET